MTDLHAALSIVSAALYSIDTAQGGVYFAVFVGDGWLCYDDLGAFVHKRNEIESLGTGVSRRTVTRGSVLEAGILAGVERRATDARRARRNLSRQT